MCRLTGSSAGSRSVDQRQRHAVPTQRYKQAETLGWWDRMLACAHQSRHVPDSRLVLVLQCYEYIMAAV